MQKGFLPAADEGQSLPRKGSAGVVWKLTEESSLRGTSWACSAPGHRAHVRELNGGASAAGHARFIIITRQVSSRSPLRTGQSDLVTLAGLPRVLPKSLS